MSDAKMKYEVGERVKVERKRLGLTQSQLCEIANISPPTMSMIEKGNRSPSVKFLHAFCSHGADLDYLVNGFPKGKSRTRSKKLLIDYQKQLDQLLAEHVLVEDSIDTAISTLQALRRRIKSCKKDVEKLAKSIEKSQ